MATTYADPARAGGEDARRRNRLRSRLVPPLPSHPVWGWIGPLLVAGLAAVLRFDRLSIPGSIVFDETYYAHDAHNLLTNGVALNPPNDDGPGFIVHPPLAKWMIAFGEWVFGYNSFGWRFAAAVVGSLSVLILARTARRMTRSTLLGSAAGLLLAVDCLAYVQSRIAMLDIFVMFWAVVAFACLVNDRELVRRRLARAVDGAGGVVSGPGPKIGMRWWLIGAAIASGAAAASKWNGAYFAVVFVLMAFFWTVGARRSVGVRHPFRSTLRRDTAPVVVAFTVLALAVYVASWSGWFASDDGWDRFWVTQTGQGSSWIPDVLRNWWHYQWQIFEFHIHLTAPHAYKSSPWGWLILARPVLYYSAYPHGGTLGCDVSDCARMIYAIGNPVIWWATIPATLFLLYIWFAKRDWRAMAILVPFAAGYLPWLATPSERTMFLFYMTPVVPFMCLALALTLGYIVGPENALPNRRMWGAIGAGSYLLVAVIIFFYFLPILSSKTIPYGDYQMRMWFNTWP